jgi:hypothetical protein
MGPNCSRCCDVGIRRILLSDYSFRVPNHPSLFPPWYLYLFLPCACIPGVAISAYVLVSMSIGVCTCISPRGSSLPMYLMPHCFCMSLHGLVPAFVCSALVYLSSLSCFSICFFWFLCSYQYRTVRVFSLCHGSI